VFKRIALLGIAVGSAWGCAIQANPAQTGPASLSPTLAQSTFIEEGTQLAIVVSTRPTRYRLDRTYLPFEVAIVNKGVPELALTRESFTLVDSGGHQYPAVGPDELAKGYGNTDVDRNYAIALPFIRTRFAEYRRMPSNFTPNFNAPISLDKVLLTRFSYVYDFLYFPRPSEDLLKKPLELVVRSASLSDTHFVRFELQGRSK